MTLELVFAVKRLLAAGKRFEGTGKGGTVRRVD